MNDDNIKTSIIEGKTALGIEFGSTRIKAVLIDEHHIPIASGSYEWENQYEDGIWTYRLEDVWTGLQACYRQVSSDVYLKYNLPLHTIGAIGFSGMMHGYMAFDADGNQLVPFRTWRNTSTGQASDELTNLFQFNIPQRWSIAHLHQAILNLEPHVRHVRFLTTLAGYVHWKLTGQKVVGIGEASGMFPIDSTTKDYDERMITRYNKRLSDEGFSWTVRDILPQVMLAGDVAGLMTPDGVQLLDPSGQLRAGSLVCPPEGDAGTGMIATNSITPRTGNVSAGTSVFAMIVLEQALSRVYAEIDMVTTPTGKPVAMVHSNNCTSDLNAWVSLFQQFSEMLGVDIKPARLFELLYLKALSGDADGGGLLAYNYLSGEHITHIEKGRPLFVRTPESRFTLPNFMRVHLFSALATLKLGLDILFEQEQVQIEHILGHGGFFKTKDVGQKFMSAVMNVPVMVMETSGEGGAWGIALLAAYVLMRGRGESLEAYLTNRVFASQICKTIPPDPADVVGFLMFMERYKQGLDIEKVAVSTLKHHI